MKTVYQFRKKKQYEYTIKLVNDILINVKKEAAMQMSNTLEKAFEDDVRKVTIAE